MTVEENKAGAYDLEQGITKNIKTMFNANKV